MTMHVLLMSMGRVFQTRLRRRGVKLSGNTDIEFKIVNEYSVRVNKDLAETMICFNQLPTVFTGLPLYKCSEASLIMMEYLLELPSALINLKVSHLSFFDDFPVNSDWRLRMGQVVIASIAYHHQELSP
ncbi:hypothetical protein Tco_0779955 [Tanacetum coccineum]